MNTTELTVKLKVEAHDIRIEKDYQILLAEGESLDKVVKVIEAERQLLEFSCEQARTVSLETQQKYIKEKTDGLQENN
jgi:hypothetical protein